MKALVSHDGELALEERETPRPVATQVLVEVAGAGVNRADTLQRVGAYPAPAGWPGDILGMEFAGVVAATGSQVSTLQEGDRVFGIVGGGGHATHVLTREDLCSRVPGNVDLVEAGGVPEVFITAHDAFRRGKVRTGETLLINGVGSGVGTAAVQLARAMGATTVGTSRTQSKLTRALDLGLDSAVLASDTMAKEIGEVDVVLELVGGDYVAMDLDVARSRARIVLVGLVAGATAQLDLSTILRKRLTIIGTMLRSRPEHEKAAATAAFAHEVVPLFERGLLKPVVDKVVPLEDAAGGYDLVAGDATFGKVVLKPTEEG
jgi:NADPH:quinone reductase-like Zn-dependent oxidoreductase